MATQNIQIDNRFAAESSSMNRIAGKGRSKQNKELVQLASIAQELAEEIAAAKNGSAKAEGKTESKPNVKLVAIPSSHKTFGEEMADLAAVLQMLQVEIVKYQRNKSKDETNISKAMTKMFKLIETDIENKIHQQTKEAHKHKLISLFTKIIGAIVTAVVCTIALAFGQVEIAALMIAMYVVMTTGVMSKVQTLLAKGLNDMGIHNKLADDIIAAAVILLVVGGVTGFIAPADIAEEVVSSVEDVTEEASDAVEMTVVGGEDASEATNATESVTKKVTKLRKFLRKIRFSTRKNLILMNVSQSLTQVNLNQIALDIATQSGHHLSDKEKEKLELILSIVVAVLAALVSLGAGDALADSMSMGQVGGGTSKAAKLLGKVFGDVSNTAVGRTLSRMSTVLEEVVGPQGPLWLERARRVLVTGEVGLKVAEGMVSVDQGEIDESLGVDQAAMDFVQEAMSSANSEQSDTQKQTTATLKQQRMSDKNLDLFAGEKALARVLTTQSPV